MIKLSLLLMKTKVPALLSIIIAVSIYVSCAKIPPATPSHQTTESNTPYPPLQTTLSIPGITILPAMLTQTANLSVSTPTLLGATLADGYIVPAISRDDLADLNASVPTPVYGEALFLHFSQSKQYSLLDIDESDPSLIEDTLLGTGRTVYRIGFANFENRMAYQDNQAKIWIADLLNRHPIEILSARGASQQELMFTWTPDDQHLIVDFDQPEQPDLIFHLQTGQWEVWDYVCDRLAYSPVSQKIAIWCPSAANNNFLVFEWGGESWYSENPPEQEVLISQEKPDSPIDKRFSAFPIYRNAGWSSDGESMAYYDPRDETGSLTIINSYGEVQKHIYGIAYWLTDFYQEHPYLPGWPVQWSLDGSRLLVLAIGGSTNACSDFVSTFENKVYHNPGCWQVIDTTTSEIIWQDSGLHYNLNAGIFIRNQYHEATISRQGQYISLFSLVPADIRFYIIDVETNSILYEQPWDIFRMRWGAGP